MYFSKDNFETQSACLGPSPIQPTCASPFPAGLAPPQGTKYGKLAQWGFGNSSDLDTGTARNAEIYQWNLGVQHLFPGQIVIGVDYSANRSTHLPWAGANVSTRNRNFIPSSVRNALVDTSQSYPRSWQHGGYGLSQYGSAESVPVLLHNGGGADRVLVSGKPDF